MFQPFQLFDTYLGRYSTAQKYVRTAVARKLLGRIFTNPTPYTVSVASGFRDLREAFRLVYREYHKRGYCTASPSGLHFNDFALVPSTKTLLLKDKGVCRGTISVVLDENDGLPIEEYFPEAVASLRRRGYRLAEISMLSLDTKFFPRKHSFFSHEKLRAICTICFAAHGMLRANRSASHIVIGVAPRHRDIYRLAGFVPLGEVRPHGSVRGTPAQFLVASIEEMQAFLDNFSSAPFLRSIVPSNLGATPSYYDYLELVLARFPDLDENMVSLNRNKVVRHEDLQDGEVGIREELSERPTLV